RRGRAAPQPAAPIQQGDPLVAPPPAAPEPEGSGGTTAKPAPAPEEPDAGGESEKAESESAETLVPGSDPFEIGSVPSSSCASAGVPPVLIPIYQRAAATYDLGPQ